jgi:hypothetical protein
LILLEYHRLFGTDDPGLSFDRLLSGGTVKTRIVLAVLFVSGILGASSCLAQVAPTPVRPYPVGVQKSLRAAPIGTYPDCTVPFWPKPSFGLKFGFVASPQPGLLELDTKGAALFGETNQRIELPLSGLQIGLGVRWPWTHRLLLFLEGTDTVLVWSEGETKTTFTTGTSEADFNADTDWRILDGGVMFAVHPRVALIGGVRYELLDSRFLAPPTIPGVHLSSDEGDLTWATVSPYLGAEYNSNGKRANFTLRIVGSPYAYDEFEYRMTFGSASVAGLAPIRDYTDSAKLNNYWAELTGHLRVKPFIGGKTYFGVYGTLSMFGSSGEVDMVSEAANGTVINEEFDMKYSRSTVAGGISMTFPFHFPL